MQPPAERDAGQMRIAEHTAVAVVPGQPQQSRLSGVVTGEWVRLCVSAAERLANSGQARIKASKECFRWKAAQRFVPEPLVPQRANTARQLVQIGDSAERGRDVVAMFQGRREAGSFFRIVPQP